MAKVVPGFAFALTCDSGFILSVATHQDKQYGDLIWVARDVYDETPPIDAVGTNQGWRWPVYFPTRAALRRRLILPVGTAPIPTPLSRLPVLRSGGRELGWRAVEFDGELWRQVPDVAAHPGLPILQIINDTLLKERVVSNWRPAQIWCGS